MTLKLQPSTQTLRKPRKKVWNICFKIYLNPLSCNFLHHVKQSSDFTGAGLNAVLHTWFSCWCHWQIWRTCFSPWSWCLRYLSSCLLLSCNSSRRLSIFKQLLWAPWINSGFIFGPSDLNSSMNPVSSWLLFKRARDFSKSSVRIGFQIKNVNV